MKNGLPMPLLKHSPLAVFSYFLLLSSGRALASVEGDRGQGWYLPQFSALGGSFLALNVIFLVLAVLVRFLRRRYFPQRRLSPLLVGLVACVAILLGAVASFLVPAFDALFTESHWERPASFVWLADFRGLLWLPAAMALLAWWRCRSEVLRCGIFSALLLLEINLLQFALIVCYSPIFPFGHL